MQDRKKSFCAGRTIRNLITYPGHNGSSYSWCYAFEEINNKYFQNLIETTGNFNNIAVKILNIFHFG